MSVQGWKYYNHAVIPTAPPYVAADMQPVESGAVWKLRGTLLARWTSSFDCGRETAWWYVIKDTPFDYQSLKSSHRYKINKGRRYFDVRVIDPREYRDDLYRVQTAAYADYPSAFRPQIDEEAFRRSIDQWSIYTTFGAFFRESDRLVGYALLQRTDENWVQMVVQKADPAYEKYQINAALVEKTLSHYADLLANGGIICDGERNVVHKTNFQDYLQRNFGFRRAYCDLHIAYNPKVAWLVRLLRPFRGLLAHFDGMRQMHKINAVLEMDRLAHGSGAS